MREASTDLKDLYHQRRGGQFLPKLKDRASLQGLSHPCSAHTQPIAATRVDQVAGAKPVRAGLPLLHPDEVPGSHTAPSRNRASTQLSKPTDGTTKLSGSNSRSRVSFSRRLYFTEPDYSKPPLEITSDQKKAIQEKLTFLYGTDRAQATLVELERIMGVHYAHKTPVMIADDRTFDPANRFTEKDIMLITYGDSIRRPGNPPLCALSDFLRIFMPETINIVHILPFFPSSSDQGFSIIDYEEVDPRLGTWEDVKDLSLDFRLMFDAVFNHVSSKSRWFQEFLNGNPDYQDYFISFPSREALSDSDRRLVLRPRTSDLLTRFSSINGPKFVWTTFSPDQVDLNFKNEKVLLRVIEILLTYVRRGADLIRLDAVPYFWSELGTRCADLQQTHALVQLFRLVLDVVAPKVVLVTESNVPHEDNISYFGDGSNEAQMVYNFALPPLVLMAFQSGKCRHLSRWASQLQKVSDTATYFNCLDCHDGVGLLPIENLVSRREIERMIQKVEEHGGLISNKLNGDGTESPYEMNITWYSALNRPDTDESVDLQVDRFVASRAIALTLMGVPGIYLPGFFGTRNDQPPILEGDIPRSINRKAIDEPALVQRLMDPDSLVYKIVEKLSHLMKTRIQTPAFHPNGRQQVIRANHSVFSVLRQAPDGSQIVLALTNVSSRPQSLRICSRDLGFSCQLWRDLISEKTFMAKDDRIWLTLRPYQLLWLAAERMSRGSIPTS